RFLRPVMFSRHHSLSHRGILDPKGGPMKLGFGLMLCLLAAAQETAHQHSQPTARVPLQPLAQQVRPLEDALNYLGQPLSPAVHQKINSAIANPDEAAAVSELENLLEPLTLATVDINPESRVKVEQGPAAPELVEAGTRLFLVKVINNGHV